MASYRELAGNRDFTALWAGATVSELGTRVTTFALPLVAYAATGSTAWAAAAETAYLAGMVGMLLPAGVLADRCHRLRLMRGSLGAGALLYASVAVTACAGTLTLPHLLAGALATGVLSALFGPAEYAAIRSVVATGDLPTALSQLQARQHVASLLGGPLGGALYGLARWAPFATNAVTYAVGWLLLGRVRTDLSAEGPVVTPRPVRELVAGLRFSWAHPFFRVMMVWSPAINLTVNALFFVAVLRLMQAGVPGWQIGLVEASIGGCGVLGALAAPWLIEHCRTGQLVVLVAWSFVPLALPMALWNHPVAMAVAASAGMFLLPAGNAGGAAYRMAVVPAELVGRVQSSSQFVSMLSMPLAPLLAGFLLGATSGPRAVLVLAGMTAAVALVPTLSRAVRAVPRPSEWLVPAAPAAAVSPSEPSLAGQS